MSDTPQSTETPEQRRQRMIDLLEKQHAFPGPFSLAVVTRHEDEIAQILRRTVEAVLTRPVPDASWVLKPSQKGTYVSHRISMICDSAHHVMRLYEEIQTIEGVLSVM